MAKGRKPHSPEVVKRVQELLAEKRLSQREIARLAGVSRTSVQNIESGEHRKKRPSTGRLLPGETLLVKPTVCVNGHRIFIVPCRQCKVRQMKAKRTATSVPPPPGARPHNLAIELRPEHAARLEHVRKKRG